MVRLRVHGYEWNNSHQPISQSNGVTIYPGHVVLNPDQKVAIKELLKEDLGEKSFEDIYNNEVLQYQNLKINGKVKFFDHFKFEQEAFIMTPLSDLDETNFVKSNGKETNGKDEIDTREGEENISLSKTNIKTSLDMSRHVKICLVNDGTMEDWIMIGAVNVILMVLIVIWLPYFLK